MRIFWSQSKHHFLCKSPFPSSDIFQFWNILISKDLENWKLKSTGNLDVGKVLKYMSALCARLPFHFEGSQVEVAVANSPKIILHQNLSSPKILNKCTFSTAEVLQIIWFLQRLSDPICEHPFKWVNPPSPVHCWKKYKFLWIGHWKIRELFHLGLIPICTESTTMKSVSTDIMTQELLANWINRKADSVHLEWKQRSEQISDTSAILHQQPAFCLVGLNQPCDRNTETNKNTEKDTFEIKQSKHVTHWYVY